MPKEVSFTHARRNFASVCDHVVADRDFVIIKRQNAEDVAIIAASDLSGLVETAYLLRSPGNASRLLGALMRAKSAGG